jgi:general secretion pathway protein D
MKSTLQALHLKTSKRANQSNQPRQRAVAAAVAASIVLSAVLPTSVAFAKPRTSQARGEAVTLNFVNAEIDGVARAMSAILKQQFLVDPRVKGQMTLYSDTPLSPSQAYQNFLAALRGLGFTVVEVGGMYKIVPEADAKLQSGTVMVGKSTRRGGDQVLTQIFRLSHENANNLVPVLRPLISPNNTINANTNNNTLVITDYADNLQRIGKIIASMDMPASGDVEVIPIKHAVASDLALLVQRLSDGGGNSIPGMPGGAGGTASVLVDQRSNSLLVRAPSPARMASIRALVDKLDKPAQASGSTAGNVWVVYLKNADAVKLATVLRAAYGGATGGSSPSTPAMPTPQPNFGGSAGGTAPGGGLSVQASTPVAASAQPSTGGFVQADTSTNSLIITAPEPMYRQLRAVIDQLDSRRAQVYVESLIVEVDADKAAEFGIQWQGLVGSKGDTNVVGGGTNFGGGANNIIAAGAALATGGSAGLAKLGLPNSGFNIGLAHKIGNYYTLGALAQALNTSAGTNILSTPNLVTLDNEEAKIIVGQNVPFLGQITAGTPTSNPFQSVERKDVGITLKLKPQIGENGTVRMTIFQESSSVASTVAVGTANAGPTTNKRSIESTVVVDDGQIIVLGGLIEDKYDSNNAKVPLLGDIPFLGALFRSESRVRKKTNLMVFLRPVIMRDQESSNKLSIDRYNYIRGEQQNAQPVSSGILRINESPVLPVMQPASSPASGPAGVLPPLGVAAPPTPASAPPPAPAASVPDAAILPAEAR